MQSGVSIVMDTSHSPLLLAVEKDGKLFTARRSGIKQEKLLFPVLNGLLVKANANLQDVSRVFIIRGPGRFTGIRIALTFASMLQMLGDCEVKGATLFEVIYRQVQACRAYASWQQNHPSGVAAVVLHAFREEYFLQIFDEKKSAPAWLSREELLRTLAVYPYPLFVAGTDKEFAPLTNLLDGKYTLAPYDVCRVQAKTLARLAQEKKWTKSALEPLYLKPARFELEGVK